MLDDLVLQPQTRQHLEAYAKTPSHAVMLVGPTGSGKLRLATRLAENILQLPADSFADHPYGLTLSVEADKKLIAIEAVRRLDKFLALKVPGKSSHDRVVIFEDAHLLSLEAQNALLKTLEEPPEGTLLILTVNHEQAMLPTIRSRAPAIAVNRPPRELAEAFFKALGHPAAAISQTYAISGGLPGLMQALLADQEHSLRTATEWARRLLSQSVYERLIAVDELAKQRSLAADIAFILQQMARVSLQTASGEAAKRWQNVLEAGYQAAEALNGSAQPKLTLTKLMLSL